MLKTFFASRGEGFHSFPPWRCAMGLVCYSIFGLALKEDDKHTQACIAHSEE